MNRRDDRTRGIRGDALDIEPVRLVVDLVRLRGCICDPPGVYFSGPIRRGDATIVHVEHDADCPLAPGWCES